MNKKLQHIFSGLFFLSFSQTVVAETPPIGSCPSPSSMTLNQGQIWEPTFKDNGTNMKLNIVNSMKTEQTIGSITDNQILCNYDYAEGGITTSSAIKYICSAGQELSFDSTYVTNYCKADRCNYYCLTKPSPSILTCPIKYETTCIGTIFHNTTMTLIDYPPHKAPPKTYILTTGKITVTPLFGSYANQGTPNSINLSENGLVSIQFDTRPPNTYGYYTIEASGVFSKEFPSTNVSKIISWKCLSDERQLKLPPDTQKPFDIEVDTTVKFSPGICSPDPLDHTVLICPCHYNITQK